MKLALHLKKINRPAVWAFAIPFGIMLFICIMNGVYPFGDRCLLHVDMYHQYLPFFTEFWKKLRDGESLLYSWRIGLGSDFVSLFAYYLASPLNWFLILVPKDHVLEFMSFLMLLKAALASSFTYLYYRHHFRIRERSEGQVAAAVLFASAYGLSGFMAAYLWNIMWLDGIALLPLVLIGLEKLVYEKKGFFYGAALGLAIFSNYYIAIMICIFSVFYFLLLFLENPERKFADLPRFAFFSLLAGGMGMVLILPELKILSLTGSSGFSLPDTPEFYFDILQELTRTAFGTSAYTGNDHWPNLYAGTFTLLLLGTYLFNRAIPWKRKLPGISMVLFFWLSFCFNIPDFIWHGFHFPDSLPGRESFLYIFLVLTLGLAGWRKRRGLRIRDFWISALGWSLVLAVGSRLEGGTVTERYAVGLTIGLLFLYALIMTLAMAKKTVRIREYALEALFLIAMGELVINMSLTGFYTTSRSAYTAKEADYQSLLQMAEEDAGGSFYRIEDTERLCKNDDARYSYSSATQFSSLMNINVSHFYQKFLMEGGKNFYCFNGATPLLSAMLSVDYSLSDRKTKDGLFSELIAVSGDTCLYKNPLALSVGFALTEEEAAALESIETTGTDAVNEMGRALGADGNLLNAVEMDPLEEGGRTVLTAPQEGHYFVRYTSCDADTLTLNFENGDSTTYSKTTHRYLLDLGNLQAGEKVEITNKDGECLHFICYRYEDELCAGLLEEIRGRSSDTFTAGDNGLAGSLELKEDGVLVFSVPAQEGWELTVDGQKVETETFMDTFICASLEGGSHQIELTYRTPGLLPGAAISLLCLLLLIAAGLGQRYFMNKSSS